MRAQSDDPQDAEHLAHLITPHFFGVALATADNFASTCQANGITLGGADHINCILEPLFFARIPFRSAAAEVFSPSAAETYMSRLDEILVRLFVHMFVRDRTGGAHDEEARKHWSNEYQYWSEVRARQYSMARGNRSLAIYRFFRGAAWFDRLFLTTVLLRDFDDTGLRVPQQACVSFVSDITHEINTTVARLRSHHGSGTR